MKTEKILSFAGAVLAPVPLVITALVSVYGELRLFPVLMMAVGGAFAWLLGHLCGLWMKKARGKRRVYLAKTGTAAAGAAIIIAAETILFLTGIGSMALVFAPLAMIFWYWFGYRAGSGRELMPSAVFGTYCVEAVFMFPICRAFEEKGSTAAGNIILIITAAMIVTGAVLINRRQLERLSFMGKNKNTVLSKPVNRFNIKLTLCFSAVILALFLFAVRGAKWLWEGIRTLLSALINLFTDMGSNISTETSNDIAPVEIQIASNDTLWAQILLMIITAAVIVLMLILLSKAVKKLIHCFKSRLWSVKDDQQAETAYTDIYEESDVLKKKKSTFRKAYRAFRREKEPCLKYRLGYRAFMIRLGELGNENAPSDTTALHRERGRNISDVDLTENIIDKYERLRYHDDTVSKEDCGEMDKVLRQISRS